MDTGSIAIDSPLPPPSHQRKASASSSPPKTQSIPIPNHIQRTDSEKMLCEEEAFAEYRDYAMYNRIVTRMIQQQEHAIVNRPASRRLDSLYENGACITNIQRNRARETNDCISLHFKGRNSGQKRACERAHVHETSTRGNFLAPTFPRAYDEDQVFTLDL